MGAKKCATRRRLSRQQKQPATTRTKAPRKSTVNPAAEKRTWRLWNETGDYYGGQGTVTFLILIVVFIAGGIIGGIGLIPAWHAQVPAGHLEPRAGAAIEPVPPVLDEGHPRRLVATWLNTLCNELPDMFRDMGVILVDILVFVIFLYGLWSVFRGLRAHHHDIDTTEARLVSRSGNTSDDN